MSHSAKLYILTDSNGFTTCVEFNTRILYEASRVPLMMPIMVHEWQRTVEGWVFNRLYNWQVPEATL